jgi:predicted PolB exonuclease-like 3'-5' exonuclease
MTTSDHSPPLSPSQHEKLNDFIAAFKEVKPADHELKEVSDVS